MQTVCGRVGEQPHQWDEAFHHPRWQGIVNRIAETIGFGERLRDKLLIAAYYGLLGVSSIGGLRPAVSGMHPQFWLGDVRASTPLGRFECRGGTTDFDIVNPNYETGLIQAVRERLTSGLGESVLVVDVGAHIGKYAILAGTLLRDRGKVIAIEADPDNFRVLENNVSLNGLTNARCINVGCWNTEGTLMLHRAHGNLGGHSFVETRGGDSIAVPVKTLDSILREQGISRIDLMKIDVERGEFRVLQGARSVLESSPDVTLFLEESGDATTSRAVRLLVEMEFNVRRLGGITYVASRNS